MLDIEGKVAVATGAAGGIGLAVARRFSAAGATVVLGDVADATDVATEMGGLNIRIDVGVLEDVRNLMNRAVELFGTIDICVNNVDTADWAYVTEVPSPQTSVQYSLSHQDDVSGAAS